MWITDLKLQNSKLLKRLNFAENNKSARSTYYHWELIQKFPSKNSTKLTSFLIKNLSKERDHILDPMSGTGTTLVEGLQLNRNVYGLDIYKQNVENINLNCIKTSGLVKNESSFKVIWLPGQLANSVFSLNSMDLILFSPPYGTQNHQMGETENQKARRKKHNLYSCQEYSALPSEWAQYSLDKKNLKDFYLEYMRLLRNVCDVLKCGGKLAIILQDYVRKGVPVGIVQGTIDIVTTFPEMVSIGHVLRDLPKTLFKITQLKRGNNVVGVEHTLIFGKVKKTYAGISN